MEAIKLCRLDTPIIFIEAHIKLSRFVVTGCAAKTSATVTFLSFFFSSRRRHTRSKRDWSSDVYSSDLVIALPPDFHSRRAVHKRLAPHAQQRFHKVSGFRSEERRVGKECRSRRWSS